MVVTQAASEDLVAGLTQWRGLRDEIWGAFARDFDRKAEVTGCLVDLAFSFSETGVSRMEEEKGIPAAHLTADQRVLLDQAEPPMRELGFLARNGEYRLAESTLEFLASGGVQFRWAREGERYGLGINWLPYSRSGSEGAEPFTEALSRWRGRREWLVRQHYADFRQAADHGRLLFELALSLSPDQVAAVAAPDGIAAKALHPEQRALLAAAVRLDFRPLPGSLDDTLLRFEPRGQFWLVLSKGRETIRHGSGWLPYSCGW